MKQTICAIIFLLLLSGCTPHQESQSTKPTDSTVMTPGGNGTTVSSNLPENVQEMDKEAQLANWRVSGKIAVQTPKNSGSATVTWAQRGSQYNIDLQGPVGTNSMYLSGGKGNVVMRMSDGKHFTAKSPEALLARQWGFQLPVSSLYYWIRGLPVPSIPAKTQYNSQHQLASLVQEGWKIKYLSYTKVGNKTVPQKIYAYSNTLIVKVMIYNWRI